MFVTAAFSFAGTELVGLAASETPDPRKTMPAAVKGTFWRIVSSRHWESLDKSLKNHIADYHLRHFSHHHWPPDPLQ